MKICSEKHEEVCYEGKYCPACEIREKLELDISDLKSDIEESEAKVRSLDSYNEDLERDIRELKSQIKRLKGR